MTRTSVVAPFLTQSLSWPPCLRGSPPRELGPGGQGGAPGRMSARMLSSDIKVHVYFSGVSPPSSCFCGISILLCFEDSFSGPRAFGFVVV